MLWALISSAFVIYLYRKLNAGSATDTTGGVAQVGDLWEELARLTTKIDALEQRVRASGASEAKP